MVVREKVGRKRYIAFEIVEGADLTRSRLLRALISQLDNESPNCRIEVIFIVEGKGIVRVDHRCAKRMVEILNAFDAQKDGFKLKTLKTSGTIKKLRSKYFPNYESSVNRSK